MARNERLQSASGTPSVTDVDVVSSALPTDAATETKQDLVIAELQVINSLVPTPYDYIAVTYPNATTEVYTYKLGGSGGSTASTITLVYADATKVQLTSLAQT